MISVQKFLFETSFDGVESPAPAAAETPAGEPQSFAAPDLERARDEGFAAGREQGLKEAAESIENATARALEAIAGQADALLETSLRDADRRGGEALQAAVAIVRKLFPRAVETCGLAEIESLVGRCLEHLRDEPRVVVRVADALLDPLHARLDRLASERGYEGKLVLLADDAFLPGDVRVEWADGGAERDATRLWSEIDEIVARATLFATAATAGMAGRAAPTETQTETKETAQPA